MSDHHSTRARNSGPYEVEASTNNGRNESTDAVNSETNCDRSAAPASADGPPASGTPAAEPVATPAEPSTSALASRSRARPQSLPLPNFFPNAVPVMGSPSARARRASARAPSRA